MAIFQIPYETGEDLEGPTVHLSLQLVPPIQQPTCLNILDAVFIKAFPKNIVQHRALRRVND